jgi:hypothetical protein
VESTAKNTIAREKKDRRARRGCYVQLIVAGILGYLALIYLIIPFFETGGGNADTREVPGDATRFDPIANFQAIKDYAGEGALLTGFDAYFVRADGTLDLTAEYYPRVSVTFVIPTDAPADAPPIGAGGAMDGKWFIPVTIDIYQPGQWRKVTSNSLSYTYVNRGMQRDTDDPTSADQLILPDPSCSFAKMWTEAIKRDAPSSAVAIIDYDAYGYHFRISDVSISLEFGLNCRWRETAENDLELFMDVLPAELEQFVPQMMEMIAPTESP